MSQIVLNPKTSLLLSQGKKTCKKNPLSFAIKGNKTLTRALQFSLFHNPGGGGGLSVTEDKRKTDKNSCII